MLIGVIEPQDLKMFDVPPLVIHRDDDPIVPIQAAGLTDTHKEKVNADRLAFAKD